MIKPFSIVAGGLSVPFEQQRRLRKAFYVTKRCKTEVAWVNTLRPDCYVDVTAKCLQGQVMSWSMVDGQVSGWRLGLILEVSQSHRELRRVLLSKSPN